VAQGTDADVKPYFDAYGITLYHGDAREILPVVTADLEVGSAVCITDPVWPNARTEGPLALVGAEDPSGLLRDVLAPLAPRLRLLAVILGSTCDPRFLAAVPTGMPFARDVRLEYARASYAGPILLDHETAYVFGRLRLPKGKRVLAGRFCSAQSRASALWKSAHPCPRNVEHIDGLVSWYAAPEETLVEPFAGSGTLLEVAARRGRRGLACEIEERWCEEAARRVEWAAWQQTLPGVAQ
jgi:hypothetical protein